MAHTQGSFEYLILLSGVILIFLLVWNALFGPASTIQRGIEEALTPTTQTSQRPTSPSQPTQPGPELFLTITSPQNNDVFYLTPVANVYVEWTSWTDAQQSPTYRVDCDITGGFQPDYIDLTETNAVCTYTTEGSYMIGVAAVLRLDENTTFFRYAYVTVQVMRAPIEAWWTLRYRDVYNSSTIFPDELVGASSTPTLKFAVSRDYAAVSFSYPLIADLDADGNVEIAFTNSLYEGGNLYESVLLIYEGNNLDYTIVPQTTEELYRNPSIWDLDDDGLLEIAMYRYTPLPIFGEYNMYLDVYEGNGTLKTSIFLRRTITWGHSGPVPAELGGTYGLLVPIENLLSFITLEGTKVWEFVVPEVGVRGYINSLPVVGDVDADGRKEVIFTTSGTLYVLSENGTLEKNWGIGEYYSRWYDTSCNVTGGSSGLFPSIKLTLFDMTEDGKPEILMNVCHIPGLTSNDITYVPLAMAVFSFDGTPLAWSQYTVEYDTTISQPQGCKVANLVPVYQNGKWYVLLSGLIEVFDVLNSQIRYRWEGKFVEINGLYPVDLQDIQPLDSFSGIRTGWVVCATENIDYNSTHQVSYGGNILSADFDGDGGNEFLTVSTPVTAQVCFHDFIDGKWAITSCEPLPSVGSAKGSLGDIDGDNRLELVFSTNNPTRLLLAFDIG